MTRDPKFDALKLSLTKMLTETPPRREFSLVETEQGRKLRLAREVQARTRETDRGDE
jgi:hypothetical protein